MDWIELIKNVSILLGVWAAIYAIDSWRREHTGKRQIELAEDTLALFYEASDAIKHIRHPSGYSNETDSVKRGERESEEEFEARKNAFVVFKRYNDHQELFNKLHAMRYRFMAQIGTKQAKPFDDIRNLVNEIVSSARRLARLWARDYYDGSEEERKKHLEKIQKHEAVFWDSMGENDPINSKLEELIIEIENTCQHLISGKGTLYGIINKKIGKSS